MKARYSKYYKIILHVILFATFAYLVIQQTPQRIRTIKEVIRFVPDIKHILLWTDIHGFNSEGQSHFINKKCAYINCYFTKNRSLLGDIRHFDLVLFNLQDVSSDTTLLPAVRSHNQKYVFVANDSSHNYPVCEEIYENFFNWTWTYRHDSTIPYKFITIHNLQFQELGTHFTWNPNMKPINQRLKSQFTTKSKAAVIFLDKCKSKSKREILVKNLQTELEKYNMTVDVFGACGSKECKRRTMQACFWRVRTSYYFYLAFEDSLSFDYVTDVVLNAYRNKAVPVVYGGADYDRFLPPGSYINTYRKTSPQIAQIMHRTINDMKSYYDFFRWRNHYIITKATPLDACLLCEMLNNPARLIQRTTYTDFRKWWTPNYQKQCEVSNTYVL